MASSNHLHSKRCRDGKRPRRLQSRHEDPEYRVSRWYPTFVVPWTFVLVSQPFLLVACLRGSVLRGI